MESCLKAANGGVSCLHIKTRKPVNGIASSALQTGPVSRKQIKKSCFARRADALAYEREYLAKSSLTTKMKFGSLVELYMADAKTRLRPTTYEMKQWIFETK